MTKIFLHACTWRTVYIFISDLLPAKHILLLVQDCGAQAHMLDTQYRMHPHISTWPNDQFYAGKVRAWRSDMRG